MNIADEIVHSSGTDGNHQSTSQSTQQTEQSQEAPHQDVGAQSNALRQRRIPRPVVPQDIRTRFIQYTLATTNQSVRSAALTFGIPSSTAYDILRRYEESGSMAPKKKGGAMSVKMVPDAYSELERLVESAADMTLRAMKEHLAEKIGVWVTEKTVSKALTKNGYTFKLIRLLPISRNTIDTISARKSYAEMFLRDAPADQRNVIWVDECGFNLHVRRKHGRARSGERATVQVANSRGRNQSICAAMSNEGLLHHSHIEGAYNTERFCEFLVSLFVVLRMKGRMNCWVILDNVRFHHCSAVAETTARAGHSLIFLPAYSPMLNPIESLFGKRKTSVRTRNVTFTRAALAANLETARATITPEDCLGWIRETNRNLLLSLQEHVFE